MPDTHTEYTVALANTRDPAPFPGEDVSDPDTVQDAARMVQQALVQLIELSRGNPNRLAILIARYAGLSYAEIGARFGMSKQGINKHINVLAAGDDRIGSMLYTRYGISVSVSGQSHEATRRTAILDAKTRELMQCLQRKN